MYICICNSVTETDVNKAVEAGASCMRHLKTELKCSVQCGACHEQVEACLNNTLEKQRDLADISFA